MEFLPKVTIMIPTYNQADYIGKNVESALSQTYPNLEVVVSDDNSTDATQEILKKYEDDKRFRYYRNSKNLGRVGNYHKILFDLAQGDWVLNLDGDDFLIDQDYIKSAIEELNVHKDENIVMVAASYYRLINGNLVKIPDSFIQKNKDVIIIKGLDLFTDPYKSSIGHLTCLYKRALALKLNFYSLDILQADSESMLRLLLYGDIIFFKKPVAAWRLHKVNASTFSNVQAYIDSLARVDICVCEARKVGLPEAFIEKWERKMIETQIQIIFRRIYLSKDFKYLCWMKEQYKAGKFRLISIFFEVGNIRKLFAMISYMLIKKTTTVMFGKPKGLQYFTNK